MIGAKLVTHVTRVKMFIWKMEGAGSVLERE
jgi:hypothetical protein